MLKNIWYNKERTIQYFINEKTNQIWYRYKNKDGIFSEWKRKLV